MSHGGAERKSRKLKAVCLHAPLHIVSQLLAALRAMKKFSSTSCHEKVQLDFMHNFSQHFVP